MAWSRSVNCRLMVAQLMMALILVYLLNISRMTQLDKQLRHSERRQRPAVQPVHPLKQDVVGEVGGEHLHPRPGAVPASSPRPKQLRRSQSVTSCPETRRPSAAADTSVWQQQDHPSGTIYIYSAVYDDRTAQNEADGASIRLVLLTSGMDDSTATIYCHIWKGAVSEPDVVAARLTEVEADVGRWTVDHQTYGQYVLSCPLRQPVEGTAELQVSMTVDEPCGSSSVLDVQRSDASEADPVNFGVCAILAWPIRAASDGVGQSVPWFVEWMEFQLSVLRAARVFLYVVFDEDVQPFEQLVRFYSDRKLLEVRKIPHPVDTRQQRRREVIANVRGLAVNDCLLRNARHFRYLMDVDVDELIVPRHLAFNYSGMVDRIETVINKPASAHRNTSSIVYFYRILNFRLDVPTDDPNASPLTTTGYFRSRDNKPAKNAKRAMVDATRCVTLSPSTGCDVRVRSEDGDGRTAKVKAKARVKAGVVEVPLNVAGCHRYHSACAKNKPDVGCVSEETDASPVKDASMLRFQLNLKFAVIQTLKDSGSVDQAGLYRIALNA